MKKVVIGDCELYLGDCLERMKEIADGSVEKVRDAAIDQIIAMLQPSFFSKPVDQV